MLKKLTNYREYLEQGNISFLSKTLFAKEIKMAAKINREVNKFPHVNYLYKEPIQALGSWAESYESSVAAALYCNCIRMARTAEERLLALKRLKDIIKASEGSYESFQTQRTLCACVYSSVEANNEVKKQIVYIYYFRKIYKQGNPQIIKRIMESINKKKKVMDNRFSGNEFTNPTELILNAFIYGYKQFNVSADKNNFLFLDEILNAAKIIGITINLGK